MFDFGNVLAQLDTQKLYGFLQSHQYPVHGARHPEEFFNLEPISDFEIGKISLTQMFERVKAELSLNVGISEFLVQTTEILNPDQKMPTIRRMLKKNGIKTVVVSNTNAFHFHYIQSDYPKVFAGFDYLMLSFRHGFKKPDHRMWEVPARHLGVSPEECFFVDDLKNNIVEFMEWSRGLGIGHYYDVTDDKFCPNGRLEAERNKMVMKMLILGMLSPAQANSVI
jgi:putative hydrolase of the HAD superfamily